MLILVQLVVKRDGLSLPLHGLNRTGDGVAAQQHAGGTGELGALDVLAIVDAQCFRDLAKDGDLGACLLYTSPSPRD